MFYTLSSGELSDLQRVRVPMPPAGLQHVTFRPNEWGFGWQQNLLCVVNVLRENSRKTAHYYP